MKHDLWFAIVTFGSPTKRYAKVHASFESAMDASEGLKGSGSCSAVHILIASTRKRARDADIGKLTGYQVAATR